MHEINRPDPIYMQTPLKPTEVPPHISFFKMQYPFVFSAFSTALQVIEPINEKKRKFTNETTSASTYKQRKSARISEKENSTRELKAPKTEKKFNYWVDNKTGTRCCFSCSKTKTPLWRKTLDKEKWLCNACGIKQINFENTASNILANLYRAK